MSTEPVTCPYCSYENQVETEFFAHTPEDLRDVCNECGKIYGIEIFQEIKLFGHKDPY